MRNHETAATRLAEALIMVSVAVHACIDSETDGDLDRVLEGLVTRCGVEPVTAAARVLECAYDLFCSEIGGEP